MQRTLFMVGSAIVFACLMLAASESAAAHCQPGSEGTLLMSSAPIERQVDAAVARRVRHGLAGLTPRLRGAVVSPEKLLCLLGAPDDERELDEVEIEVRAPPGVPEQPLRARIPFGLAALAWAARHPSQSWRLVLPVLS
jgi:hypothetical protein